MTTAQAHAILTADGDAYSEDDVAELTQLLDLLARQVVMPAILTRSDYDKEEAHGHQPTTKRNPARHAPAHRGSATGSALPSRLERRPGQGIQSD